MTSVPLPRSLASVFGTTVATQMSEESLSHLIGLRETDELEVKSAKYENGDSARRELASDVAAFANYAGGLLVIGASEKDDVVDSLVPLDLAGEELRIRQILASSIVPLLDLETVEIASKREPGKGYLLIVIPRSPIAPHAVAKNSDLRYLTRYGPGKRNMSESEVADRYRTRFSTATSRVERLRAVHDSIQKLIKPDTDRAWLILSALPEVPGIGRSSRAEQAVVSEWVRNLSAQAPYPDVLTPLSSHVTTGYRRFVIGDWSLRDHSTATSACAELHHDGAAAIAVAVGHDWKSEGRQSDEKADLTIGDEGLSFAVMDALLLLGSHAQRLQGGGQVEVAASLFSNLPVHLGQARGFGEPLGARPLAEFERLVHTLAANDIQTPGQGLVAASYIVASDLIAGFGFPETLQMDPEGNLQWQYINSTYRPTIEAWANRFGVSINGRG